MVLALAPAVRYSFPEFFPDAFGDGMIRVAR
jgi:hypothetical protein